MKKAKLQLDRETLRTLNPDQLTGIVGGLPRVISIELPTCVGNGCTSVPANSCAATAC